MINLIVRLAATQNPRTTTTIHRVSQTTSICVRHVLGTTLDWFEQSTASPFRILEIHAHVWKIGQLQLLKGTIVG